MRRWCRCARRRRSPTGAGREAILNIGMNDARHAALAESRGVRAADALYLRFIQAYALQVAHLDAEAFDLGEDATVAGFLAAYEAETDEPFPQDPHGSSATSCSRWRGRGTEPRRGFCARRRARRATPGSGSSCRRWRWGWAGPKAGPA